MSDHRLARRTFRPLNVLLTVGAVLGVTCLLAATACIVLGLRPMVVTSGSMSPAIPAGSLVFAQGAPAADAEVGDVVAVNRADGSRVMHRVVSAEPSGGQVALTLQGDANATPDPETYVVDRVLAVRFDLPMLGYPVTWLSTPWGLLGLGAAACGLVMYAFRRTSATTTGRLRVAALRVVPVATALVAVSAAPSSAMFTDTGTVTSAGMTTHSVVVPASASCSAALLSATVSWPGDARYDYEVVLRRVSNGNIVSTTQVTGASASITYSGLSSFGLVVGLGTVDFQVEIRSYLANATTWRSPTVRTYQYIRVMAIVVGANASCTS